ncbi:MAG TPA: hypothetical protein VFH56_03460 [Acidimicrobiales bacterium]|nr:hypothetical protein [Acidimicrobiales bacterium]
MRWLIEREPNAFEGVGARVWRIQDGALLFFSEPSCAPGALVYALAPGQWITVCPEADDE